jgi:hypothetical protein
LKVLYPGGNPKIVRYNASGVKFFENKIFSSTLNKALAYYVQRQRCSRLREFFKIKEKKCF